MVPLLHPHVHPAQTGAACNDTIQMMARYLYNSEWPSDASAENDSALTVSASQAKLTWQPFCDQMLIAKGHVAACFIASNASGIVFASAICPQLRQKIESAGEEEARFGLLRYETEVPQEDGTDKVSR